MPRKDLCRRLEYQREWRKQNAGYYKAYIAKNRDKYSRYYRKSLLKQYGLTPEDYSAMLASQGGVCAICGKPECAIDPRNGRPKSLAVDHSHATGVVRGLLCVACNNAIGALDEDPSRFAAALEYLKRFTPEKSVA